METQPEKQRGVEGLIYLKMNDSEGHDRGERKTLKMGSP